MGTFKKQTRTISHKFRVTEEEEIQIRRDMANADYLSMSKYFRDMILKRKITLEKVTMTDRTMRNQINDLSAKIERIGVNYNQVVSLYHQQSRSGSAGLNTRSLDGKMTELMRMTEGLRDEFALFLDVMRTYLGDEPANQ